MCGIAGFVDGQVLDAVPILERMCHVIRHRGPDDQGTWAGDGAALGMRRLAIIDVAGGSQPVFNEDESVVVVFNGEIYNYQPLRETLARQGHRFRTRSDTEVIVHAYEQYGDRCVEHLRGMFVFALWDRRRQRLLLARDRFGKKPLNYYWDGTRLVFGSEIKSLLMAGVPRALDPVALDEYLAYGYVPSPKTMFQGVLKLPAAHTLAYEHGRITLSRYWDLSFQPTSHDDEQTAIERVRALLADAVGVRLMSEVPLGAFLSGGIDSSLVVALMSQQMAQPVKTFSIGFEEDQYNELAYARQVARAFGTDHREFVVRPALVEVLPQLVWAYDEPFADESMLPTYYVSKLAREFVTVVLTGDGGDEIFGGYARYARELAVNHIPAPLRRLLGAGIAHAPAQLRLRERRSLASLHEELAVRYARTDSLFAPSARAGMYTPEFRARLGDHDPFARSAELFAGAGRLDAIAAMQYVDVHLNLVDDILVKVDKASMLSSVETRAPLLDQELAAYVASLPSAVRTPGGALKSLLKRAAAEILPADVLDRPKQGFGVPIGQWFRGELSDYAREVLDTPRTHARGILAPAFVRGLLSDHASTRSNRLARAIWVLLCLELWFAIYLDSSLEQIEGMASVPASQRPAASRASR